jgi:DNA (cytosine-5)-methyltransferase 1
MNKTNSKLTYISLFSSAGIGCFGFKQEGFECIATCELLKKRLDIQKFNNKCKYETGYIAGDIYQDNTFNQINNEIDKWNSPDIDVIIATPHVRECQLPIKKRITKH